MFSTKYKTGNRPVLVHIIYEKAKFLFTET